MKSMFAAAALLCSAAAFAQTAPTPAPAPAQPAATTTAPAQPAPVVVQPATPGQLPLGTQIPVRFLHEVTTENRAARVGDRVRLEVAAPVMVGSAVVIPQGTPVVGELTDVRNKGMWGRSGRLVGRVLSMQIGDRTIRMSGGFDDKGVTGTAGVVAAVALVPVVGFFVTGTSARISQGSIANAFLDENVNFTVDGAAATAPAPIVATPVAPQPGG